MPIVTGRHRSRPRSTRRRSSGARIGVLRQLFVGITGERQAAQAMESVIAELRSAGATVLDVSIADLDEQYRRARGVGAWFIESRLGRIPVTRREARGRGHHARTAARIRASSRRSARGASRTR